MFDKTPEDGGAVVTFLESGGMYSQGKEEKFLKALNNVQWEDIYFMKTFLPTHIEKIVWEACSFKIYLDPKRYCYSNAFFPLHFFGIMGVVKFDNKEIYEDFYLSDEITTTPILTIAR